MALAQWRTHTTDALAVALKDALDRDRLSIQFERVVRFDNGALHGVEALCRWHDPVLGNVPPALFIPAAERTGLIRRLDYQVTAKALMKARNLGYFEEPRFVLSVNFSASHFSDRNTPRRIGLLLERYQVPAHLLCLEVTENHPLTDDERAAWVIKELQAIGVSVSLDDYGAGYMRNLAKLRVQQIKLDRSLLLDAHNPRGRVFIAHAMAMSRNFGLEVVAEGIETAPQAELAREIGCDLGQGFFFAPPDRSLPI